MTLCKEYCKEPQFKETLRLIGDFWTLRIIATLESEDLRFCSIERALGDSNPATLTARLKKLEQHELVARRVDAGDTLYTLTPRGAKLLPIVEQMQAFARAQP